MRVFKKWPNSCYFPSLSGPSTNLTFICTSNKSRRNFHREVESSQVCWRQKRQDARGKVKWHVFATGEEEEKEGNVVYMDVQPSVVIVLITHGIVHI